MRDDRSADERKASRPTYFDARCVLDEMHVDLARIAAFASAAREALGELVRPRLATIDERRSLRTLDAFVIAVEEAATAALQKADSQVDRLEGRKVADPEGG